MTVGLTTTRYVRALFTVAEGRGERERVRDELNQLGSLFAPSPKGTANQTVVALRNPRLPAAAKQRILEGAGLDSACDSLKDFVSMCLARNRAEVVLESPEEFARLDREARGIVRCTVESAVALDEETRGSVKARLEEITGKSVELEEEVRTELIGGLRVLISSRMYDGSVRRQLDDLTSHLQSTRIN